MDNNEFMKGAEIQKSILLHEKQEVLNTLLEHVLYEFAWRLQQNIVDDLSDLLYCVQYTRQLSTSWANVIFVYYLAKKL